MVTKNKLHGFYTYLIKNQKEYLVKNICKSTNTRRKQVQKLGIENKSIGYLLDVFKNSNGIVSFVAYLVTSNGKLDIPKKFVNYFSIDEFEQYKANYKELK